MRSHSEPAVGWRIWRMRGGRLWSWVLDYAWERGQLEASCMLDQASSRAALFVQREPCVRSPGQHCQCGIWALWDLGQCVARARNHLSSVGAVLVVGLIAGSGTVAIHGDEGFRAQRAAILCLLTDSIWDKSLDPLCNRVAWWPVAGRWLRLLGRPRSTSASLRRVAAEYAVPVLPLADGVRSGVLAEFGLSHQQLERARSVLVP
jgi:hypothetical protein